ncbi:MAG: hypothetical protein PVH22_09090 [Desulfobacteraceae bacterium]|jgi:hypothetical protein
MISYMPFTYVKEPQKQVLTHIFGTFTVYSPAQSLLPSHMRSWGRQGELEIRHPMSVDASHLIAAIKEHKAWAELNQGSIGDMAVFFKKEQGRIPMMEETNPTQIGHRIRHYGEPRKPGGDDSLFKAALFLSLAQEYDAHHHGMIREMDAVDAMEQQMLQQLSGNTQAAGLEISATQPSMLSSGHHSISPHMTLQRVRAWSRVALDAEQLPLLFMTPSQDVVDHVLEIFSDLETIEKHTISVDRNQPLLCPSKMREAVKGAALGSDSKLFELESDPHLSSQAAAAQLAFYKLVGVSAERFLTRLAAYKPDQDVAVRYANESHHTLIGLVTA